LISPLRHREHREKLFLFVPKAFSGQIKKIALTTLTRTHKDAQLLTYLKLTGLKIGLLINFNVPVLKQGIRRLIV